MNDERWRNPTEEEHQLIENYFEIASKTTESFKKKWAIISLILASIFLFSFFDKQEPGEKLMIGIMTILFGWVGIAGFRPDKINRKKLAIVKDREYEVFSTHIADYTASRPGGEINLKEDLVCPENMPGEDYTDFNKVKLKTGKYQGKAFLVSSTKIVEGKYHRIEVGDNLLIIRYKTDKEEYDAFTEYMLYNGGRYYKKYKKLYNDENMNN